MGFTDKHGRPELIVDPAIIGSKAVYRTVDTPVPAPVRDRSSARNELQRALLRQRDAEQALAAAEPAAESAARANLDAVRSEVVAASERWQTELAEKPGTRRS